VAERIVAKDGHESILSISVKAFGRPKYVQTVKAGSFNPPPKVDSAILLIDNISNTWLRSDLNQDKFFEIVKKGFSSKRKMLKNNLKISGDNLRKCGISEKARAEQLVVEDWRRLSASYPHIFAEK
jgi:16S rRNA (adenine1518-N6/adenine1519-N6)-dimethyltransferase